MPAPWSARDVMRKCVLNVKQKGWWRRATTVSTNSAMNALLRMIVPDVKQTCAALAALAWRGPMLRTAETSPSFWLYSCSHNTGEEESLFVTFCDHYDLCPYITRHNCLFLHSFRFGWLTLPNLPSFIEIFPVVIPSWNQIFPDSSIIRQVKW